MYVCRSLSPLFDNPKMDRELRSLVKRELSEFINPGKYCYGNCNFLTLNSKIPMVRFFRWFVYQNQQQFELLFRYRCPNAQRTH